MNEQYFNQLLIQNREFLESFSISLTRDREESKDLIQETLCRALINREKFQLGTNIRAWLYTIMRNIFINNYRRHKEFPKLSSAVLQEYHLCRKGKVAYNDGLMNIHLKEIRSVINKLPDTFRLAFEMHFAGYKYQEIADMLKEPLGTIKSRVHFARKILTGQLEPYERQGLW
ncbi:MAG TPA: RNA polymerase sigma factor [Edaphocola sp.]|nr:RNA polymerase sigma factor [Edaphocola sp.]